MKAILCTRPGTPDDLVLAEIPDPIAAEGEALVKVGAVGLNFFDTLIIAGKYQKKPPFPFSPCGEFAGVVESLGPGVTGLTAGDRVIGYCTYGAARERIAVEATKLVRLNVDLDPTRAAGLIITYGTAYHALIDRGRLKRGEALAVLGAAGGVGLAAVELGKLMGAHVIACASTDDKLALARAHGAAEVVNYGKDDLRDELKRLGGEHGIDVIFDPVGGPYSEAALRAIAWEGRFLVIGFPQGIAKLPLNLTLLKSCQVVGVFWGAFATRDPRGNAANTRELFALYEKGAIRPRVSKTFSLADSAAAIAWVAGRKALGKVVVKVE
jgi:NADPH:quinone reductase